MIGRELKWEGRRGKGRKGGKGGGVVREKRVKGGGEEGRKVWRSSEGEEGEGGRRGMGRKGGKEEM